jgi:hypothetical protein
MYVPFVPTSNNVFIIIIITIIINIYRKLEYITDYKNRFILYHFNTSVRHMVSHTTWTLFALQVSLSSVL